nr:hypothetical protein [Tanacetum cinerariifolium]
MPPKTNLVFHTAPIDVETEHSAFNVQFSPTKPVQDLSHSNKQIAPIIEDWVSDSEDKSKTTAPLIAPSFVQSFEQVKTPRHSVQPVKATILDATLKQTSPKFNRSGKRKKRKTCFVCKSVDHLIKDYDYHAKKKAQPLPPRNYAHRGNHKQYASLTHKKLQKHMDPTIVLTQSKPVFNTAVRLVSVDVPKIIVTRPRHAHSINTKSKSPIKRHITRSPSPKTSNSPPKVTAVKALVVSVSQGSTYKQSDSTVVESGGCWYFSKKEIEERSPSRSDGIDLKKETYLRKSYCTFLQDLGMRLKVPQQLVEAIKKLKVTQTTLVQVAWNFMNDGLQTSLFLQFKPHHIAVGAIFLAAKFLKVDLQSGSDGKKVWWQEFNVTPRHLEEVSNQMLELYEKNRIPLSQTSEVLDGSIGGPVTKKARASAVDVKNATNGSGTHAGVATSRPSDHARTSQDRSNDDGSTERNKDINSDVENNDDQHYKSENVKIKSMSGPSQHSPADAIKKLDKEKFKAALAKRKKARGDVARRTDLIDDDDLLERVLEDEIELAKPSNHRDNDLKLEPVAQPSNLRSM